MKEREFLFDFPKWDSLTHVEILTEIESVYSIKFPSEKRFEMMTVDELASEIGRLIDNK